MFKHIIKVGTVTILLGTVSLTSGCIRKPYEASYDRNKIASVSLYGRMLSTCPEGQKSMCQQQYENFFNDCHRVHTDYYSALDCEREMELNYK